MKGRYAFVRGLRCMLVAAATTILCSCITARVWGFDSEPDAADAGKVQWSSEACDHPALAWWQRVLLTPLTLAADIVTAPLQCWLCLDADDENDCRPRPRRGC